MEISVNINNGVERIKYEYLSQYKDKSLSGIVIM